MAKNKEAIEAVNLTKRFGDIVAVNSISFSVPYGSIFAFLGPNGAGKTTTIKMLVTILRPDSGEAWVAGHPLSEPMEIRKKIGVVFQDSSLDDELTAMENMQFHAAIYGLDHKTAEKRIKHLMRMVGLWERRNSFVSEFSGGMRRRLEIARAMVHNPDIIFLDEPTVGLDPQTRLSIWKHLKDVVKQGKTVMFTTHYMEEAEKMAKSIAIIDHGRIISSGTPESIMSFTSSSSLEEAFIKLTGRKIRDEEEHGSMMKKVMRMRRRK